MYGAGNYEPPVEAIYWSMRVMAYAGMLIALIGAFGAMLLWRELERLRWFLWLGVIGGVLAVRRLHRRLVPDRDRPPAVGGAGLAEDRPANSPTVTTPGW